MSNVKDGGPAFPVAYIDGAASFDLGMSIRDWFAGQALPACWRQAVKQDGSPGDIEGIAERSAYWAYALADAMLKARADA